MEDRYRQSTALYEQAQRLIPGGIHLSGTPLVPLGHGPLYLARGQGAYCWDVDGNQYIDYLMAFGPFLLGYANAEVDQAALSRLEPGKLLSLNHSLHLAFVEKLLDRFPAADMGIFFKTGSEATTAALRLARRHTGRRKVARCGYHGWHDWCLPLEDFVPAGLDQQVLEFSALDPQTLQRLANEHELAAVILAPEMVTPFQPALLHEIQSIARAGGAVFILDEVKTAFRTPGGSIQQHIQLEPDLTTLSKALGNGWPVAAVVGRREIMQRGAGMHYSATFHGDTASIAAAMAVLQILEREPVAEHVGELGQRLIDGLNECARRHGAPARAYGEPLPAMPFLAIDEPGVKQRFYIDMLRRGVLLHPRHMWFISYAHTAADIDATLEAADAALEMAMRVRAPEAEGPFAVRA